MPRGSLFAGELEFGGEIMPKPMPIPIPGMLGSDLAARKTARIWTQRSVATSTQNYHVTSRALLKGRGGREREEGLTVFVQGRLVLSVVCAQLDQVVRVNFHRRTLGAGGTEPLAIEEGARR